MPSPEERIPRAAVYGATTTPRGFLVGDIVVVTASNRYLQPYGVNSAIDLGTAARITGINTRGIPRLNGLPDGNVSDRFLEMLTHQDSIIRFLEHEEAERATGE